MEKKKKNKKAQFWKETSVSFLMVGIVISICWLIYEVLSFIFNPLLNFKINCIIVAPFVEEYAKRISIKKKFPFLYNFIFSFGEFFLYLFLNIPMWSLFFISQRLLCVGMHYLFLMIQKEGHESGYDIEGFGLAVGCHTMQNFLAIARTIGI